MASAASLINGFAFQLPPQTPEDTSVFLGAPENCCLPMTAFWLTRHLPPSIDNWMTRTKECSKSPIYPQLQKALLAQELAIELGQNLEELIAEAAIRCLVTHYVTQLPIPRQDVRANLFNNQEETVQNRCRIVKLLIATMNSLPDCVHALQRHHPGEDSATLRSQAVDIVIANIAFPLLIARAFELQPTPWKSHHDFDQFQQCLRDHGPMLINGQFGQRFHKSQPVKHGISILGKPTVHWSKLEPQFSAKELSRIPGHVVLLIGAAKVDGVALAYYQDLNKDDQTVFAISYSKLMTSIRQPLSPNQGNCMKKLINS